MDGVRERIANRFAYPKQRGLIFSDKDKRSVSRTKQSFAKEADINEIVKKAHKTGVIAVQPGAKYGDFSNGADYLTYRLKLIKAEEDFMRLPAAVRDKFGNDIPALIDFLNDPKNDAEAVELGLKDKSILPVKTTDGTTEKVVIPAEKATTPA